MAYKFKFKGFSLIEVLMTLMVLSLVLVLMVPIITKKFAPKNSDGIVYTYTTNRALRTKTINGVENATYEPNSCYVTGSDDNHHVDWSDNGNSSECSEYDFVVPKGVNSVNLTLVAGGGGGGGASGIIYSAEVARVHDDYPFAKIENVKTKQIPGYALSDIKKIVIQRLNTRGQELDPEGKFCSNQNYTAAQIITSGDGGYSSAAILNYEIPSYMYKNIDVYNPNNLTSLNNIIHDKYSAYEEGFAQKALYMTRVMNQEMINKTYFAKTNPYTLHFYHGRPSVNGELASRINYPFLTYKIMNKDKSPSDKTQVSDLVCNYNSKTDSTKSGLCGRDAYSENVPREYVVEPHPGGKGHTIEVSAFHQGDILQPGEGGTINNSTQKGQGAQGCTWVYDEKGIYSYAGLAVRNSEGQTIKIITKGYPIYDGVEKHYNGYEDNKYTGGGGSGGNAVRIIGFKVNPGDVYRIRVGKGGAGGLAGKDYEFEKPVDPADYKNDNIKAAAMAGKNGQGGVSTSVWKVESSGDETFLFMVTGGQGGEGAYYMTDNNTNIKRYGRSGSTPVGFLYNQNKVNINDLKIDRNIGEIKNEEGIRIGGMESAPPAGMGTSKIKYNFLLDPTKPYWTLNEQNYESNTAPYRGKGVVTTIQKEGDKNAARYYLNGFSSFNHPTDENSVHLQHSNSVQQADGSSTTNDEDRSNNIYDGFYYRNYLNNGEIGYVGGLGGFSGLGGRAGCGGYFMGNSKGIKVNNQGTAVDNIEPIVEEYKNKFIIRDVADAENGTGTNKKIAFNVSDYYENCSINTPNGQSAKYVAPSPKDRTFGQAGAGGGGGGYSADVGPGNGGDGQNGYVMIDWRK